MKTLLKSISFTGLGLMLVSAVLVFNNSIGRNIYQALALAGTAMWFATVPFWMKRRLHHSE
ncbi:MAG: hypothetical protein KGJ60_06300 [Verrucomicrobiota bacterium]|nr:hypothetical protein [Verrucomicrobiota bacterium]